MNEIILASGKAKYEGRIVDFKVVQDELSIHEPSLEDIEMSDAKVYTSKDVVEYNNDYPYYCDKPIIGELVDDLLQAELETPDGHHIVYGWYSMPACGSDPMQVIRARNVRKADFMITSEWRGACDGIFNEVQSVIEGLHVNIILYEGCCKCGTDKHVDSIHLVDGLFVEREGYGGPMNLWALSKSEATKYIEDYFGA